MWLLFHCRILLLKFTTFVVSSRNDLLIKRIIINFPEFQTGSSFYKFLIKYSVFIISYSLIKKLMRLLHLEFEFLIYV